MGNKSAMGPKLAPIIWASGVCRSLSPTLDSQATALERPLDQRARGDRTQPLSIDTYRLSVLFRSDGRKNLL